MLPAIAYVLYLQNMEKLVSVAFLLLAIISHSTAEIKTLTLTSDRRSLIPLQSFAFDYTGHVAVSASYVSVTTNVHSSVYIVQDPSRFGFFLLPHESLLQVLLELQQEPRFCILDSHYIAKLFTFRNLSLPPHSSFDDSYPITSPGLYSLYFANCGPNSRVSMKVHTEFYNLDASGSKDYLSVGQSQLISVCFVFSLAYLVFLVLWIYCGHSKRKSMDRIHLLMAGMLAMNAVCLICSGLDKHFVKITGTPHGWNIVFFGAQVALWLIQVALISVGLWFLNPHLEGVEKNVVMTGITLQIIATLVPATAFALGESWPDPVLASALVFIMCTVVVLLATFRPIWSLREVSKTDEKAALKSTKMKRFASMYVLVMSYFYGRGIAMLALDTVLAYQYRWVSDGVGEPTTLAFYAVMLYMCRPVKENDYSIVDGQEEDMEGGKVHGNEESEE